MLEAQCAKSRGTGQSPVLTTAGAAVLAFILQMDGLATLNKLAATCDFLRSAFCILHSAFTQLPRQHPGDILRLLANYMPFALIFVALIVPGMEPCS
jgi:hypothetical protein